MIRTILRGLPALGCLLAGLSLFAQEPAPPGKGPDLAEYRTVDQATQAKIVGTAKRVAQTGYLGVVLQRDGKGKLVVEGVQPDSPAAKAGVQVGDVVTRVGDETVRTPDAFREWLQTRGPGDAVKLGLVRGDKALDATATLAATSRPLSPGGAPGAPRASLGVTLGDNKEGEGVRIETVLPMSAAETAGMKVGDRINKVDGKEFVRGAGLPDLLAEKKPGDVLAFTLRRDGKDVEVKATLVAERGRFGDFGPPPLWRKDVFRLAVVPFEFPDVKHHDKNTPAEWDKALFSTGVYKDKNATGQAVYGSLNDYFVEQSFGALRVAGKVYDWVEVGKKRTEYVQGSGTSNKTAPLTEALEKLVARDGKDGLRDFDGILFVYAGEAVRSNRGAVYYPHAGSVQFQGKRVPYLLAPEGGAKMTSISGLVPTMGQVLGLPELAARTENAGSEGLGTWCALSSPLPNGRPQHFNPWAKEKLGWLKPAVIDPAVKQKLALSPIEDSPKECYKVLVRPDGSEYFLLEHRKKKGFDSDLPGDGLLIWRVVGDRPILEESHGVEGPTGPSVHLGSVPYPSPANNAFTPDTTPSSRSPLGGGFPVHLTEIRRLPDGRIGFHVGYEYR